MLIGNNCNPLRSLKERDVIIHQIRKLEDQRPKTPKEHDIREKKLKELKDLLAAP